MVRGIGAAVGALTWGACALLAQESVRLDLDGAETAGVIPGTPVVVGERGGKVVVVGLLDVFALDIREGDRILAVDGTPVSNRSALEDWYASVETGSPVRFEVVRDEASHLIEGPKPAGTGLQVMGFITEDEARERGFLSDSGSAASGARMSLPGLRVTTPLYGDLQRLRDAAWIRLANDPVGDQATPGAPDVVGLSFWYETSADVLWTRLDLAGAPSPEGFGVNIVIDTDRDQTTGSAWWGGNRSFTYDRYVTVWVEREGDELAGVIGIGDAEGAAQTAYNNVQQGGIEIALDDEARAIMIGIVRSSFDADLRANVIAAVGTSSRWSDDITDQGYISFVHPQPKRRQHEW